LIPKEFYKLWLWARQTEEERKKKEKKRALLQLHLCSLSKPPQSTRGYPVQRINNIPKLHILIQKMSSPIKVGHQIEKKKKEGKIKFSLHSQHPSSVKNPLCLDVLETFRV
jgi:hypothetical protein